MSNETSKQIKAIVDKIKKELEVAVKTRAFYSELGNFVENQIRKRTRLGYGVSESGKQQKLAATKESTQKAKKNKKKNNTLSKLTTPKKSNLTDSGQLLDAIVNKPTTNNVVITFNDQRSGSDIGNKELAYEMKKGDPKKNREPRPFFKLSNPEIESVKRLIEKKIQEMVKRFK